MDGIEQLICCSTEGEIKGYKAISSDALDCSFDRNVSQDTLRDMTQRKKNLLLELGNLKEASVPSVERKFDEFGEQSTGIPVLDLKHIIFNIKIKNFNGFFFN